MKYVICLSGQAVCKVLRPYKTYHRHPLRLLNIYKINRHLPIIFALGYSYFKLYSIVFCILISAAVNTSLAAVPKILSKLAVDNRISCHFHPCKDSLFYIPFWIAVKSDYFLTPSITFSTPSINYIHAYDTYERVFDLQRRIHSVWPLFCILMRYCSWYCSLFLVFK